MSRKKYIAAGFESDEEEDFDFGEDPVQKTCKNLKITVVPNITANAGINYEDFDDTLPEDIQIWFGKYRNNWNLCKKIPAPATVGALKSLFLNDGNPLLLALKLFANCPGCSNVKKQSLPYFVLETIEEIRNEKPEILQHCTKNMKMVAFNFVKTQGNSSLYKLIANAYDLKTDKDLFEEKIKYLISQQNYKDASQWAIILGLTEKFGLFDMIFPMILQDKIFMAEEYLEIEKSLRIPTIKLLDSLLDKSENIRTKCNYYINLYHYNDVKIEKLQYKSLSKLIIRLSKKYNIPADCIPNVTQSKSYGYLKYLIHKKYVEKIVNNDSWRELIFDTLSYLENTKELKYDFITSIVYNFDYEEALFWAEHFNFKFDDLPIILQEHITKNDIKLKIERNEIKEIESQNYEEDCWDEVDYCTQEIQSQSNKQKIFAAEKYEEEKENDNFEICWESDSKKQIKEKKLKREKQLKDKFYHFKLNSDQIKIVETPDDVNLMLNDLENELLISFDSEWKPTFQLQPKLSLIQLAKIDKVYLIDAQSNLIKNNIWEEIGRRIFNNIEIIKIGFALNQDLSMFQKCLPSMNIIPMQLLNSTSFIDLQELWKKLVNLPDFHFPYKISSTNETLTHLVELCFGEKLDKSNQLSNWSIRPLRKDQITYAALDAHCLLEIYEVIRKQLDQMGIDIEYMVNSLNTELKINSAKTKSKKKQKCQLRKKKDIKKDEEEADDFLGPNKSPVKVSDVKFICDNMLEGLAKSLRRIGLDCIAITLQQRDYLAEMAIRESRYLLTRGYRYEKFLQYLPKGHCYQIQNDYVEEQTFEVIKFFNIIVTEDNVFSRCKICNCNEFILATNKNLKDMKMNKTANENKRYFYDTKINEDNMNIMAFRTQNCKMSKITPEILETKVTPKGIKIKLDISDFVLNNVEQFYICEGCGKCYWKGSHWDTQNIKSITSKLKNFSLSKSTE